MKINKVGEVGEVKENKGQVFVDFLSGHINSLNILESNTVLIFQLSNYYLHTFFKIPERNKGYKYGGFALVIGDRPFDSFDHHEYYSEEEFKLLLDFAHKNKNNV